MSIPNPAENAAADLAVGEPIANEPGKPDDSKKSSAGDPVADYPRKPGYSVSDDPMLLTFLGDIDARSRLLRLGQLNQNELEILDEVDRRRLALETGSTVMPTEARAWDEAYRLERMMAIVEPGAHVLPVIELRLADAAAEGVTCVPRLTAALLNAKARAGKATPDMQASEQASQRALLLEVLAALCWTKQRKFFGRPLQKSATRRIVWAGILSFALFLAPYALICVGIYTGNGFSEEMLTSLPLWTALTAGLFGAYFSRLFYIQAKAGVLSIGELKTANEWTSILLRGCVGMCGGLVVFFFLRAGLVEGSLFPTFSQLSIDDHRLPLTLTPTGTGGQVVATINDAAAARLILPRESLALLAVWCFLAGFSERLVPSILSSTEEQLDSAFRSKKKA
jgi:hypothetical protein